MAAAEITVNVVLRRRPWLMRLLRFPLVCSRHYRTMRRYSNDRLTCLVGAWALAGLTVSINGTSEKV